MDSFIDVNKQICKTYANNFQVRSVAEFLEKSVVKQFYEFNKKNNQPTTIYFPQKLHLYNRDHWVMKKLQTHKSQA